MQSNNIWLCSSIDSQILDNCAVPMPAVLRSCHGHAHAISIERSDGSITPKTGSLMIIPFRLLQLCYKYFNGTGSVANAVCSTPLPSEFSFEPVGSLPSSCPAGPSSFAGPGEADIYPGRFVALPEKFSCFYWQCLSYFPAEDPDILYDLGRQEALAWVAQYNEDAATPSSSHAMMIQSSLTVRMYLAVWHLYSTTI